MNVASAEALDKQSQPTIIYLVRHAEKDISDPANQDPDLTPAGIARAEALRTLLASEEVAGLYATKYLRTKNTLKPIAESASLEVKEYNAHDFSGLGNSILEQHKGKTVVVAGHSNTILPLIEALGAKRPVPDISDSQYDYLFKVVIAPDGAAAVDVTNYGSKSE